MAQGYERGFQTLTQQGHIDALPVRGTLPDWLAGTLVRNGPAQFEVGGHSYRHWFDGLAMLHAFTFGGGRVGYTHRFLQSNSYQRDNAEGKIHYRGFAVDPCRSLFGRVMSLFAPAETTNNAVVNVMRLADKFIAMTELPMMLEFDPRTLETLGVFGYDDGQGGQTATAHPHLDAEQGLGINYQVRFGRRNFYEFYTMGVNQRRIIASIPVRSPAYIHSFGMTQRYLVLAEFSLKVRSAVSLLLSGKPFIENFEWLPQEGAAFYVIDRGSGALVAQVEADPFFAFHHVNAYEDGDSIVLDICANADASIIQHLYLDRLRANGAFADDFARLRRYRIPLNGGRASEELLSDALIDLPRIHYRAHNARPYRYAYGAGMRQDKPDFLNQLVKVDVQQGTTQVWHEDGCYPGEPVFVPAPDARAEDDGLLLSVVLDSGSGTSFLLVQDAASFAEIARASVPHHIPFGFHGQFFGGLS